MGGFLRAGKAEEDFGGRRRGITLVRRHHSPRGGSWGEDGNIIAALAATAASVADSLRWRRTHALDGTGARRSHASLAADSAGREGGALHLQHIALRFDGANIEVMTLADHRRKTLQRGGTFGRYLPASNGTGHLVYINKGTLFAVPFDLEKLEVRGTPSPVLEEVAYSTAIGSPSSIFRETERWYTAAAERRKADLVTVQWLDAAGKTQPLLAEAGQLSAAALVAGRPAPGIRRRVGHLGVRSPARHHDTPDVRRRRQHRPGVEPRRPLHRYSLGLEGIWWARSDGAGKPQLLIQSKNPLYPFSFTPDGKRLAYNEVNPATAYDIWTAAIESDGAGLRAGKPESLPANSGGRAPAGLFSRRPLAGLYFQRVGDVSGVRAGLSRTREESGRSRTREARTRSGRGNGRNCSSEADDNRIMVAPYAAKADSFVPDKPRVWSDKRLANFGTIGIGNYDRRAGRQAHRRADARRDSGSAAGAEPRDLPRKLLRRVAAEGAGGEVAPNRQ